MSNNSFLGIASQTFMRILFSNNCLEARELGDEITFGGEFVKERERRKDAEKIEREK